MRAVTNWGLLVLPANDGFGRAFAKLVGTIIDDEGEGIITSPIIQLYEPQGGGDVWPYVMTRSGSEYLLKGCTRDHTEAEWLELLRRVLAGERIY